MDAARFPNLSAYLKRLPLGLESHAECQAKGSMVRSALDGHDLIDDVSRLPRELAELIESPPPPTRWVPLVHAEAIFHVVCDRYYPTEQDVIEWTFRRTQSMAQSAMYRRLVAIVGPRLLLKTVTSVHGLFEKGTSVEATLTKSSARVTLSHPAHVHSPLNHAANLGMARAIVELTGATLVDCTMIQSGPDGAIFELSWK